MADHYFQNKLSKYTTVLIAYERVLHTEQSEFQHIEVIDSFDFGKMLVLDGVINLTERDEFIYHEMMVHVPLFSHPNPQKILIIGGGDGGSVRETLKHDTVTRIQLVEIDHRIIDIAKQYFPFSAPALENPRVEIQCQNGIEFLKTTSQKYDVIIIDSTDQAMEISQKIFTQSFFKDCYDKLDEQGILTMQVGDNLFEPHVVNHVLDALKNIFPINRLYLSPIPAYTISPYTLAFCSKSIQPDAMELPFRFDRSFKTRYYNPGTHKASFALPPYLEQRFAVGR